LAFEYERPHRLQDKINKLIEGLPDPRDRVNVASTIYYLLGIFSTGKVSDEEIRNDLYEICRDVYSITMVDSTVEEITKKAKDTAEDLLRTFKLASIVQRAMSKYRIPMP